MVSISCGRISNSVDMANTTQGLYAPLPQSISDSDSEKELQVDNIRAKSVNGVHKSFERSANENDTCPLHISNWENQHEDFEFKGKINVVNSAFANSYNMVLLFKKSLNDEKWDCKLLIQYLVRYYTMPIIKMWKRELIV
ncbi:hypothetical protein Trydic_g773 [Trypoxylus dichotomus]